MIDLESGQDAVSADVPTPTFKDNSADSHVSNVDPMEFAKQVAEILRPDFEKMAQSTKDKRIAALEKRVGGLAELEEMGVSIPENVKLEMRLRDIEAKGSAPQANSQGSGKVEASEWSRIVEEIGLDTKSPEYVEFLRQEFKNLDQFEAQANRLKRKMDSKPNPTIETSPSLDGKKSAPPPDVEAKTMRLAELQKNRSKYRTEIEALEKELYNL